MDDICAEIEGLVEEAGEQQVRLRLTFSAFPWHACTWRQGANHAARPCQTCT